MAARLTAAALLLVFSAACGTTRVIRLDTGQGEPLEYRPPPSAPSVTMGAEAFEQALSQMALETPLILRPPQEGWLVRASYPANKNDTRWQRLMSRSFSGLCAPGQRRSDCLSVLDDWAGMTEWDKLGVALGLSLEPLKESISKAVEDTLAPQLFYTVIATSLISWVVLAANPEPVFTKAAATVSAILLICLGVETFLELVDASREMKRTTDRATTWEELDQAGQRFAKRVGPEVARVFVLAVTIVVSHGLNGGSAWLASRLSMLPAFSEAAAAGLSRAGISFASVGDVRAVAVVGSTIIISLPATAMAMAVENMRGAAARPVAAEWYEHHIATDKWTEATHSGGPWTPKFQRIFDRAGMSLNDPANKVRIRGHQGPHPQEYHERIYERLEEATKGCSSTEQCRKALTEELLRLAKQLSTEGTSLNKLVTRSQ